MKSLKRSVTHLLEKCGLKKASPTTRFVRAMKKLFI